MIRNATFACIVCVWFCQTGTSAEPRNSSELVLAKGSETPVAQASVELKARRQELARLQAEIARLEELTGEFEKLRLGFRFIDTDVTGLSDLGIDPDTLHSEFPSQGRVTRLIDRRDFEAAIELMKDKGAAMQLAKRTLIVADGRPASIHTGGEFPILVPQAKGTAVIQWRSFGNRVDATCRILGGGKLHLECTADHTRRDFSNAVELQGTVIPGLTTRRVTFESEMEFGRALVVFVPGAWVQSEVRSRNASTDDDSTQTVCLCVITAEPVAADDR